MKPSQLLSPVRHFFGRIAATLRLDQIVRHTAFVVRPLVSLCAVAVSAQAPAQPDTGEGGVTATSLPHVAELVAVHRVLQGPANPFQQTLMVAETYVFDQGSFLQLMFDRVAITGDSRVEITSLIDGDSQVLTAKDFEAGVNESAYFNGNAVRVRLWAGGRGAAPSLRICGVNVGRGEWQVPASICGATDDRTLTNKAASARLLIRKGTSTYVCSGWLVSTNTGFATAGHCLYGASSVTAQFNCPNSTSSGAIVNPAVIHQYLWQSATRRFSNGGPGNDYGVFRTGTSSGLTPYQRQGSRFTLAAPAIRSYSRHGFGTATGTRNFAAKLHSGLVTSIYGYQVNHRMDTTGGDSGGVVWRDTTVAIAVHTHSGCTSTGGANAATSAMHPTFRSWVAGVQ